MSSLCCVAFRSSDINLNIKAMKSNRSTADLVRSRWCIDKSAFRHQKDKANIGACTQRSPLVFHPQSMPTDAEPALSLSLCLCFRALKGAFHGGTAERSTQVHARQLPPSLPCQQARYWSVIDCCAVTDSQEGIYWADFSRCTVNVQGSMWCITLATKSLFAVK